MNKCVSCGSELPPQTRFCGTCGTVQPDRIKTDDAGSIETVRATPQAENTPANTPPPPPQHPQPGQEENKPHPHSSAGQPSNPPSGPQPQTQTSYGDSQQPPQHQQPYSNYQAAPPPYGNYQPTPEPQPPYNYQPNPGIYNYQPNPPSQPPYGDYQQPQSPYGNYQQPPQPSFSGIHTSETVSNGNVGIAGAPPTTTGTQPKTPAWRKWAIIGVVVVLILAGSGLLLQRLLVPPLTPTINVTSDYRDNNGIYAGSGGTTDGTTFHVTGNQFAANSAITFLLDSTSIKDVQAVSDPNGRIPQLDLKVTSAWPIGQHKLTALDANNNRTNTGAAISIVSQGQSGTPGPYGAPHDTKKFKVNVQFKLPTTSSTLVNEFELDVNYQGQPPVCSPGDNGPQYRNQSAGPNGTTLTHVSTYVCGNTSTYKEGRIEYYETLETDTYSDAGGKCELTSHQPSFLHVTGNYTTSHQFSGEITLNAIGTDQYSCTGDLTKNSDTGAAGTWTGPVSEP